MIAGSEMYNCDEIKCECHNKSFFNSCAHADDRHYASCDTRLKPKPKPDWISVEDKPMPRTGVEFIACNMNQGGCRSLIRWSSRYKAWMSKGEIIISNQNTHWTYMSANPEPPKTRSEG